MNLFATIPILGTLRGKADTENFSLIEDIGLYASRLVGLLLLVASIAAFGYLFWGGLNWIMAGGEPEKVKEAREKITQAITGLAIVAASWAIFLLLNHFFGLGLVGDGALSTGSGSGGSGSSGASGPVVCIYPTRRCCDDVNDSTCFCQNPTYQAINNGTCDAGGGFTGVLCSCQPN